MSYVRFHLAQLVAGQSLRVVNVDRYQHKCDRAEHANKLEASVIPGLKAKLVKLGAIVHRQSAELKALKQAARSREMESVLAQGGQ